jgi:hypothetical protein
VASIEKRTGTGGRPALRVVWREDGRKQSETFGPRRDLQAKAFLRDVEANGDRWPPGWLKGVGYPRPDELLGGYTVRSACIRAIDVNQRADRATIAGYRREVDRYLPQNEPLASLPVEHVTVEDILDLHVRLSSGLSLMVKMGHIQRNLATGLGPGRSKRKKVQALSINEYRSLLDYIPEHYAPLIETLARTGMRFSEATALVARRVERAGVLILRKRARGLAAFQS